MAFGGFFSRKDGGSVKPENAPGESVPGESAGQKHSNIVSSAARLQLLDDFEDAGLGWFWATDEAGRLTYISGKAARELGQSDGELLGEYLYGLVSVDDLDNDEHSSRPLPFLMSARKTFAEIVVGFDTPDGRRWWSLSGKPKMDAETGFCGYSGSAKDITVSRQKQLDASRMAQYDSLTGLANRHRMGTALESTLSSCKSTQRSCALLMLDLDRFKQVNDTLGHPAGDELLQQVAERLGHVIDGKGEIGRLGGDEFQVILPDMEDRGELGELANRLIQAISQPFSVDGSRAIIGTSIGIAVAPYDGFEVEELVSSADLALYAAKRGGGAQFRFYSSDLKDNADRRREIEEDLRDAFHNGEFELRYQPIVRNTDAQVEGFEAIIFWNHPARGPLKPEEFIPIAEESGLICDLGRWALLKACSDACDWPPGLHVAVDVSAVQFAAGDLEGLIAEILGDTTLPARRLELEIAESVFMGDPQATQRTFEKLKKIGVRLALDDFGTGYSSLGNLRTAPFDRIKIDQGFVREATEDDQNNSALITAIVSFAGAMKIETVAEGVDAMEALKLMTALGASHMQGGVFAPPLPQSEIVPGLSDGRLEYLPAGPDKYRADRRSVFRKVHVIHLDQCFEVVMRNLSRTGAAVDGLQDVPIGAELVLDLGGGQLVVSKVRRVEGTMLGLQFETPLVSDGKDGLCTRYRVSPYSLAAAGMPVLHLGDGYDRTGGRAEQSSRQPSGNTARQVRTATGSSSADQAA